MNADGDHAGDAAGAEAGGKHDRQKDDGKGEEQVGDAHGQRLETAAARGGRKTERHAQDDADEHRDDADLQDALPAGHQHREDIAAEMVGSEQVIGRGGCNWSRMFILRGEYGVQTNDRSVTATRVSVIAPPNQRFSPAPRRCLRRAEVWLPVMVVMPDAS